MRKFRLLPEPIFIALIALLAIAIHGYHLGSDDAEIYVPAIKKVADPALFPFGSEFFMTHARLSFFSDLVGNSARLTQIPVDSIIFLWHAISIFLLLAAARELAEACFQSKCAQWAGVALLAAALSIPVAGTALVIMDPYVTARSLSTPALLFAIAGFVRNDWRRGFLWLLFTALVHPQMCVYGVVFLACFLLAPHFQRRPALSPGLAVFSAIPMSFDLKPAHGVYRDVLFSRSYFFVTSWTLWEWLGVFAPLALLWWLSRTAPSGTLPLFQRLTRALIPFGLTFTAAGIALASSDRFENFARLQPMRGFHLFYVIFFVLMGGLIGEYILTNRIWRWCCLFLPLAAVMWAVQAQAYPSSPHIEWPGASYRSGWLSAFIWIRNNTPKHAVFALDPDYMGIAGDDQHGFRAVAERSALADNLKDSGAVSLFPHLAAGWNEQVNAQAGWRHFQLADYRRLAGRFGVSWFVVQSGQPAAGLVCPYQNDAVFVCRLN